MRQSDAPLPEQLMHPVAQAAHVRVVGLAKVLGGHSMLRTHLPLAETL